MKNLNQFFVAAVALLGASSVLQNAHAQNQDNPFLQSAALARKGGVQGGGGDTATEGRIHEIRRDLVKWISEGGAKALDFSKSRAEISYDEYVNGNESRGLFGMNDLLLDGAVVVNAIRDHEQRMDDEELNTYVDGYPKTCKGFFSKKDGRPHILCNSDRFWELKDGWAKERLEAEQYRQIHHEYASLGGLELNSGSDSDTSISSQITSFLRPETVLRLAVVEAAQPAKPADPFHFINPSYDGMAFKTAKSGRKTSKKVARKNQNLADKMCFFLTHRNSFRATSFTTAKKKPVDFLEDSYEDFPGTIRKTPFDFYSNAKVSMILSDIVIKGYMNPRDRGLAIPMPSVQFISDIDKEIEYFTSLTCE